MKLVNKCSDNKNKIKNKIIFYIFLKNNMLL